MFIGNVDTYQKKFLFNPLADRTGINLKAC